MNISKKFLNKKKYDFNGFMKMVFIKILVSIMILMVLIAMVFIQELMINMIIMVLIEMTFIKTLILL